MVGIGFTSVKLAWWLGVTLAVVAILAIFFEGTFKVAARESVRADEETARAAKLQEQIEVAPLLEKAIQGFGMQAESLRRTVMYLNEKDQSGDVPGH